MKKKDSEMILEKLQFYDKWSLSDEDVLKRIKKIDLFLFEYVGSDDRIKSLMNNEKIKSLIEIAKVAANLKPIEEEQLIVFLVGIITYIEASVLNDANLLSQSYNMMSELVEIISEYYRSDIYMDNLLRKYASDKVKFEHQGIKVKFTKAHLKKHLTERMNIIPLTRQDIDLVKSDFANYNRRLYLENDPSKTYFELRYPTSIVVIHEQCQIARVIDVDIVTFFDAIGQGNFSKIVKAPFYQIQHLVFLLSKLMNDTWYSQVTQSVGWSKSQCGGLRNKIKGKWVNHVRKEIERVTGEDVYSK